MCRAWNLFTHSLTRSLPHSLTHSLFRSLPHSLFCMSESCRLKEPRERLSTVVPFTVTWGARQGAGSSGTQRRNSGGQRRARRAQPEANAWFGPRRSRQQQTAFEDARQTHRHVLHIPADISLDAALRGLLPSPPVLPAIHSFPDTLNVPSLPSQNFSMSHTRWRYFT